MSGQLGVERPSKQAVTVPVVGRRAAPLQALRIGAVNDPLEAEAERVAAQVLGWATPSGAERSVAGLSDDLQRLVRRCPGGCDCPQEEQAVQCAPGPDGGTTAPGGTSAAPPEVEAALAGPGRPLGADDRAFFEPRFGVNSPPFECGRDLWLTQRSAP